MNIKIVSIIATFLLFSNLYARDDEIVIKVHQDYKDAKDLPSMQKYLIDEAADYEEDDSYQKSLSRRWHWLRDINREDKACLDVDEYLGEMATNEIASGLLEQKRWKTLIYLSVLTEIRKNNAEASPFSSQQQHIFDHAAYITPLVDTALNGCLAFAVAFSIFPPLLNLVGVPIYEIMGNFTAAVDSTTSSLINIPIASIAAPIVTALGFYATGYQPHWSSTADNQAQDTFKALEKEYEELAVWWIAKYFSTDKNEHNIAEALAPIIIKNEDDLNRAIRLNVSPQIKNTNGLLKPLFEVAYFIVNKKIFNEGSAVASRIKTEEALSIIKYQ